MWNRHSFSLDQFICVCVCVLDNFAAQTVIVRVQDRCASSQAAKNTPSNEMNFFITFATIALATIICLMSLAEAGGDKSARTTVSFKFHA